MTKGAALTLGFHVRKGHSYEESINDAIQLLGDYGVKQKVFQIFVMNSRCGYKSTVDEDDVATLRSMIARDECRMFAHSSYVNVPWGHDWSRAISNIEKEMMTCAAIGIEGLVVHLTAAAANEDEFMRSATRLLEINHGVTMYLEINPARSGPNTFESVKKLGRVVEWIAALGLHHGKAKIGLCVDTAHLWSCGVDVGDKVVANKWIRGVDKLVVQHSLPMLLHLNDSNVELGAGIDRHASLRHGEIWDGEIEEDSLHSFLKWARDRKIPVMLERSDEAGIISDLNVLKHMHFI